VECGADAFIGLCSGHDESPDSKVRQHSLEGRVLEGVAVVLLDEGLGVVRSQLGDDPPVVASLRKLFVRVLDPDDRDLCPPCLLDERADVGDYRVALVGPPRRRRSARRRRGVRYWDGSRVWSWSPLAHPGLPASTHGTHDQCQLVPRTRVSAPAHPGRAGPLQGTSRVSDPRGGDRLGLSTPLPSGPRPSWGDACDPTLRPASNAALSRSTVRRGAPGTRT
jgi:hypothetical protein